MNKFRMISFLVILAMLFSFANISPTTAQVGTIFYVKQAATGSGDGLSWANATTLQDALSSATSGAEIWVAKGLYKPTSGTDQAVSFMLIPGVAVYGGFDPDNGIDAFNERDWGANTTVLSGDIDGNDITDSNGAVTNWANINITDGNSIHVVVADGTTGVPITNSTILDGFIITAGYANGGGTIETIHSGGFYCNGAGAGNDCSPSLTNVTFSGNRAQVNGGGMFNDGGAGGSSSPTLNNVTFSGNKAGGDGGGMYNGGGQGGSSSPTLTSVTFDGNVAGWGGGMYNDGHDDSDTQPGTSSPSLTNVNFANNSAEFDGGAIVNDGSYNAYDGISSTRNNSSPTLNNVTFTNNSAGRDGGAMFTDGRNQGRSSPILIDVTFTGNLTTYGNGGAMYNAGGFGIGSPTLTGVTFDNNLAANGGAMYNEGACSGDSSPTLNRVTFSNNSAINDGGAMYNQVQDANCASPGYSNPILSNVAFSNNSATNGGGAIYNNFVCTTCAIPASLTNVSFSLNSANQGGAIYNNAPPSKLNDIDYRSTLTLTNVIFWGDSSTNAGAEIYNRGADLTISYSVIEGDVGAIFNFNTGVVSTTGTVTDGGNNLTSDPLFVNAAGGDLQLPSGSPAIDAGDDAACPATDLLGATRPQGAHCDIGAYEYVPPYFTVTFDANGGTGTMASQTSNISANLTSNAFTRTDYNFTDWNTAADGTGVSYADGVPYDFTADLDLFAQWSDSTDFVITVKTDNLLSGSSTSTQFKIPTTGSGYNYNVDCNNDGTDEVTGYTSSIGYTCDYGSTGLNTSVGTYTIRIRPNQDILGRRTGFPRIYFNYGSERLKLLDVQQWGTGRWTSMNHAFSGCDNLGTFTATDSPDLSIVTDMSFMFTATHNFSADIGSWNTSNVTNMAYMFQDTNFNGDIGSWNTSNVSSMINMFQYAIDFNQDISGWDTSKVPDMSFMFQDAWAFNQNIGGWNTGNVTNMRNMFDSAKAFNQNIGSWNTGKVTNMNRMFISASDFNQNIGGWDTGNVTDMSYMFQNASAFNQNLGAWNVAKVTNASNMFAGKALSTANYDALLIGWDVQTLRPNVPFSGGWSRYCAGETARANMISSDGWTITDLGKASCFTVTFDANGGTGSMSLQNSDVAANLTNNTFTRTGYTFTGWNTTSDGSGTAYADGDSYPFTADAVLYAQWGSNDNTPVGSDVPVQPVDTNSGTAPITLTFAQITQTGTTSLTTSSTGTPPPAGFQLGNPPVYYDLSTTALFEGQVVLCIDYTGTSFSDDSNLQLHHYENGAWVDRTISLDTKANIICASVTSLSPFAPFENVNVNEPPIANNDSYSTNEDTGLVEATVGQLGDGVLANDTDANSNQITAVLDTTATNGALVFNMDGSFTYTPAANYCGTDSFTYHANDGTLDSNIATVNIDVTCLDDAPVASDNTATVTEDDPATPIDVLTNDNDVDGGPKSIASVTQPANGTVINNGTDLTYEPDANYCNDGSPTDDFTYTLAPGGSTATVRVRVTCVNDAPAATDDGKATDEDTPVNVDVQANDSAGPPNEDQTLVTVAGSNPANGTATINLDGTMSYAPDLNFYGTDTFAYVVCDNDGLCDTATVTVTVNPINDAPVADGDAYNTDEDTALNVAAPGVLDGDTDVENHSLTAMVDTSPSNGTLTLNGNGSLSYTPNADFCGADSFTYHANDGTLDSNIATVVIDVTCVDDAPVASDNTATVTEDDPATPIDVLTNDSDVDGGPKSIASVTQPTNGTVVNNGTDLTYKPDANYCNDGSPTDDFTYTLAPGGSTATVHVTVICVDDTPVADNDSYSTNEDTALSVAAPGVLDGDTDMENDPLTSVLNTGPSNGTLVLSSEGSFTYTPAANFCGTDSFTYHANDGTLDSNIATVNIDVTCVDDAPVVTVDVNSQTVQYSDIITDVTISATDVDSASLSISDNASSDLSVGDESCSPSGSGVACTWKLSGPARVAEGTNTITFTVSDGNSSDNSASTDIIVNEEDATITFDSGNPVAVPVSSPGADSELFSLYINVQEASESGSDTAPGNINLASVSVTLEPVGPGSPVTIDCASTSTVTAFDYNAVLEVKCDFSDVPVNAYVATATVSGGYYTGSGEDSLVVYDPSLGFTTGGGWFYWPGTNDRTTFGYTMKYNKNATKVQGNLVLIRHLPDGSIYRLKSNAINGLALGEENSFGWASFSGKATYIEPGWLEAEGNHTFTAYVEDHGEPGSSDRLWIEVRDKDGNVVAALSMTQDASINAETLHGGNIIVPRKR